MCRLCDSNQGHHQQVYTSKFKILSVNYNKLMGKKIGLFWLREDFRIANNYGLQEATCNHDEVVVFYLYKKSIYQNQQAQKWWLSKSILNFKKKLSDLNISLEVIKTDSFKEFFDKLLTKKNISIYWNRVYEPDYLKFDEYLSKNFNSVVKPAINKKSLSDGATIDRATAIQQVRERIRQQYF